MNRSDDYRPVDALTTILSNARRTAFSHFWGVREGSEDEKQGRAHDARQIKALVYGVNAHEYLAEIQRQTDGFQGQGVSVGIIDLLQGGKDEDMITFFEDEYSKYDLAVVLNFDRYLAHWASTRWPDDAQSHYRSIIQNYQNGLITILSEDRKGDKAKLLSLLDGQSEFWRTDTFIYSVGDRYGGPGNKNAGPGLLDRLRGLLPH